MRRIQQGRIVWLKNVIDTRGNPTKPHRAVIVTPTEDIEAGEAIRAVYISSKFKDLPADCIVTLLHAKGGHPHTGLDRPSAAICDWTAIVRIDDIDSDRPHEGLEA
jgi:hypothetical protein